MAAGKSAAERPAAGNIEPWGRREQGAGDQQQMRTASC